MNSPTNIDNLKKLSSGLLDDALKEIRSGREKLSKSMDEYFFTAEYLILKAKEYVDGAWDMLASEKCDASIALSRWVLEASMNLLWVVADRDKIEQRLRDLVGEALRCEAILLEDSAKLWQDDAQAFVKKANKARETIKSLGAEKLDNLYSRIDDIKQSNKPTWPQLYALYRICCVAAHPGLKVWERYVNVGNETLSKGS